MVIEGQDLPKGGSVHLQHNLPLVVQSSGLFPEERDPATDLAIITKLVSMQFVRRKKLRFTYVLSNTAQSLFCKLLVFISACVFAQRRPLKGKLKKIHENHGYFKIK